VKDFLPHGEKDEGKEITAEDLRGTVQSPQFQQVKSKLGYRLVWIRILTIYRDSKEFEKKCNNYYFMIFNGLFRYDMLLVDVHAFFCSGGVDVQHGSGLWSAGTTRPGIRPRYDIDILLPPSS
jgi:hypothetical protein